MLKTTLKTIVAIAAISITPAISAQTAGSDVNFEASGGVGMAYDTDISVFSATGRVGAFVPTASGIEFGAEGEFTVGLGEDELEGVDISLNSAFGGFAVGRMGNDQGSFHLRLGYAANEFELSADNESLDVSLDGFALGVGGTYYISPTLGVRGDITRTFVDEVEFSDGANNETIDVEDSSFGIANVSLVYRF